MHVAAPLSDIFIFFTEVRALLEDNSQLHEAIDFFQLWFGKQLGWILPKPANGNQKKVIQELFIEVGPDGQSGLASAGV